MAVYIIHEIILFAPGVCVIRGQLTACVRVVGKVIDCHERIRDHLENGPLRLLVCSADLEQCCEHLLYHKVRHLSLLKCHIFGCLTQRLPRCQALEDIT